MIRTHGWQNCPGRPRATALSSPQFPVEHPVAQNWLPSHLSWEVHDGYAPTTLVSAGNRHVFTCSTLCLPKATKCFMIMARIGLYASSKCTVSSSCKSLQHCATLTSACRTPLAANQFAFSIPRYRLLVGIGATACTACTDIECGGVSRCSATEEKF